MFFCRVTWFQTLHPPPISQHLPCLPLSLSSVCVSVSCLSKLTREEKRNQINNSESALAPSVGLANLERLYESTVPMYFVFCRLYPFFPQPPQQCLAPTCHLSPLNQHCIGGAGPPNHMIGEVSWDPERRRVGAS